MLRKILELRVLKAIVDLSRNPPGGIQKIHFVNDSLFKALTPSESEKFTRIFLEYPGFKDRYSESRAASYDPEVLSRLPENTLGFHYAKFMRDHQYLVDWYPPMEEKTPLHFARNRQYQTHDILHTITGFSGSAIDEIGLQGFYTAQAVPNPTAMLVFTAATLSKLQANEPAGNIELMDMITRGYLMGKNAKRVIFRKWEDDWNTDITKLREELGIHSYAKDEA